MRRSAATFTFTRPNEVQRRVVLIDALAGMNIRRETIDKLVALTGPEAGRPGFTFSDLTQRMVPAAVLHAFPDGPVTDDLLLTCAADLEPTPVFSGNA